MCWAIGRKPLAALPEGLARMLELSFPRAGLAAGVLAATAMFVPAGARAAADVLTFAAPGAITNSLAPYYYAGKLGYFDQENLKFDVVVLQGSGEIIPQLVKGAVTASMITPDVLISSRQPGKPNFPLHFVYNVFRQSIWQMAVLRDSSIHGLKDLQGKTVGVGALTFANVVQTKALLRREGVDPASVGFVAVGSGGPALEALRKGRIDALNQHAMLHAQLELEGTPIRRLPFPPEFAVSSSHGLVFSDATIKDRPDLAVRFGRVLAKGTVACQANPQACIQAYWDANPAQKPATREGEARDLAVLKVVLGIMTAFPEGAPKRFGAYSERDWITTIDSLKQGGELAAGAEIPLDSLYTDRFVDEINRFDADAVVRQARAD